MPETISLAGSGLVFVNTYGSNVSAAYHTAIVAAENYFQSHFTNSVTLNMSFDLQALSLSFSGQNSYRPVGTISYAALANALRQHATTADDAAAVASLPTTDPSGGRGFEVPIGMARILGLAGTGTENDDSIILNSSFSWTYGADAIGVLEHEISEGAMGRIGTLGLANSYWAPMDLFRYSRAGQRDYTGGYDGRPTYFSVDGAHLLTQFHNSVGTNGVSDKYDLADWDKTVGDAFGPGGVGSPGAVTAIDLRVMDILGWTPTGSTPPTIIDDFANGLTDTTHPFGQVAVNGSATGTLEVNGDRDWFRVQLTAGTTYVVNLLGTTLVDPYLWLHNATGTVLVEDDDIDPGINRNSQITYTITSSGTYYLEAGAFADGYSGSYQINLNSVTDDYASSLTDTSHPFGVLVNGGANGTLEVAGDRDWFRTQLNAGSRYLINLVGNTLEDPYLRVHDASGATLAENDDIVAGIDRNSRLTFTAPTTGTYYLEAGAFDESYTGTYSLAVSLTSDDYANSLTDTSHPFGQASVNGTVTGNLEVAGDRDWFRIQLIAGVSYTINLSGNTLPDSYIRLHDSNGVILSENDDISPGADLNSRIIFSTNSGGNYYLEAGSFIDAYSGTYSLTVTASTPSIVTNLPLSVTVGGTATILSSMLAASDIDDTAGQLTYTITTRPAFGTLLKSGSAAILFTQQDINNGLISYRENGTVTLSDSFIFQVTDPTGFRSPSTQFRIQIPSATQPATIIGIGIVVGTNGKHDVFLRTASNQLLYQQYDNGGPLAGQLGIIFQGNAWVIDAATVAIGSSQSFWGYGGHDVFLRNAAGQLVADEFASDGSAIDCIALTYQGTPWIVSASTSAIGSGQGF